MDTALCFQTRATWEKPDLSLPTLAFSLCPHVEKQRDILQHHHLLFPTLEELNGESWPIIREIAIPCGEDNKSDGNEALESRSVSTDCLNGTAFSESLHWLQMQTILKQVIAIQERDSSRENQATTLHKSPELIHLLIVSLYPLTNFSPFSLSPSLLTTTLVTGSRSLAFLDSTCKCYYPIFIFGLMSL